MTSIIQPVQPSGSGSSGPGPVVFPPFPWNVNLVEAAGMTVNVTAGDLDIHTTHIGANYDSMRIGDGTDELAINADGSINTSLVGSALNYGVSTAALRTASQIGNTTGQADFNTGSSTAQTLRTVLESTSRTDISNISTNTSSSAASLVTIDTSLNNIETNFDVALSTRASEATLSSVNTNTSNTATSVSSIDGKINDNYGVSTGAVRTAAQVGNTTGQADFNVGAAGAQTLRTVLESTNKADITAINTATTGINAKLADNYGAAATALRTASQVGNATGAADFNAGTTTAQTLRVVLPTDQTAIPVTFSGSQLDFGSSTTAERVAALLGNPTGLADFNFGTVGAQTLRVGAQVGNATGAADFNYGTVGAQTLRTAAEIGNATGAADFNSGTAGAQTLRTVISTTARTAAKTTVSTSGSVTAGKQSVTFITDTSFTGTIAGDTTASNTTITFSVNGNDTLGAISYTVTAGSMQILTVV